MPAPPAACIWLAPWALPLTTKSSSTPGWITGTIWTSPITTGWKISSPKNSGPFYYFTTKAPQRYTDVAYPDGAYLVFGREDAGLPEALLAANQDHCIRMPMRDTCRSLNLSNSVAVGVYEVLRQWDFPELLDHGHLRDYEWK